MKLGRWSVRGGRMRPGSHGGRRPGGRGRRWCSFAALSVVLSLLPAVLGCRTAPLPEPVQAADTGGGRDGRRERAVSEPGSLRAPGALAALRERLAAAGDEERARAFARICDELVRDPHGDPRWSREAFAVLARAFADDERVASRPWLRRLLEVYLRWDRSSVRNFLREGPGRRAREGLYAILHDEREPPAVRVAAASCLLGLGWRDRQEAFAFALAQLDAPDRAARIESAAVLRWYGGWELWRSRTAVRRKVFEAAVGPRGEQARAVIVHGLRSPRGAARTEATLLEALGDERARAPELVALLGCLSALRPGPVDAAAVAAALLALLEHEAPEVRRAALAALAELRRELERPEDGTARPFESRAAARRWWEQRQRPAKGGDRHP